MFRKYSKVIWGIDVFNKNLQVHERLAESLKTLVELHEFQVEIVHVLTSDPAIILSQKKGIPSIAELEVIAKKKLDQFCKKLKLKFTVEPRVIPNSKGGAKGAVKALTDYALRTGCSGLIVATHGRKGAARFFLGSFTETLLLTSKIPVLVVAPGHKKLSKIRKVFFPHDLSMASIKVMKEIIPGVKVTGGEITIYHHVTNSAQLLGLITPGGSEFSGGEALEVVRLAEAQNEKMLKDLKISLNTEGVKVDLVLDRTKKNLAQAILENIAKKKVDLVVMASQSGRISTSILGSTARRVVRESPVPVFVHHVFRDDKLLFELSDAEKREAFEWVED